MAFFGFDNSNLEDEKRKFLAGDLNHDEDIAVYNWGADDYDGLGNALQEGGDELNDETFGGSGPVGKDFDFATHILPEHEKQQISFSYDVPAGNQGGLSTANESSRSSQPAHESSKSHEALWNDKSLASFIRHKATPNANAHTLEPDRLGSSAYRPQFASSEVTGSLQNIQPEQTSGQISGTINYAAPGVRTLQEIEAEMRAQTQRARAQQAQQRALQAQQLQEQQQTLASQQQPQQQMKPPRMRSQSPFARIAQGARVDSPSIAYQQQVAEQQERLRMEELERQLLEQQFFNQNPDPRELYLLQQAQAQAQLAQAQAQARQQLLRQQQQQQHHHHALPPRLDPLHQRIASQGNSQFPTREELELLLRQEQARQLAASIGVADASAEILRRQSPMRHSGSQHQMRTTYANQMLQQGSPGIGLSASPGPTQADIAQVQMQQRLLAQMAQQEFSGMTGSALLNGQGITLSGVGQKNQEVIRAEAMKKIMEAEKQEGKRRRKAAKIAHMSRYNDLMTQSDKDFITRIQVSQLVTSDPYNEDFYAQVYGSLLRTRLGITAGEERVLKFGSGEGVGLGLNQRGGSRRPNAMQRMEAQVERIVNNARQREKEKGLHAIHSLQGALGKTAGRSYKAAPRQLLQVDTNGAADPSHAHGHISKDDAKENAAGAAKEAAQRLGAHTESDGPIQRDPLSHKETLVILENLYDILLKVEQLRREQPPAEDEQETQQWNDEYAQVVQTLWDGLMIMVPLEACEPHPFISLMMPAKGKRLLPRLTRHLSHQQVLTLLTLIVACFTQLDVVKNAALLDSRDETPERAEVDKQTEIFLSSVLQGILPVVAKASLRLLAGLLSLLMNRCDILIVISSRPGLSLLTAFLSRVEVIKTDMMAGTMEQDEIPSEEDLLQWQNVYDILFHTLAPHLLALFPSTRSPSLEDNTGVTTADADILDQPVWKFLATIALQANNEQQQFLVSSLREKILDNVLAVNKGFVADENEQSLKITNVNIFLHALGLDSSQITL